MWRDRTWDDERSRDNIRKKEKQEKYEREIERRRRERKCDRKGGRWKDREREGQIKKEHHTQLY